MDVDIETESVDAQHHTRRSCIVEFWMGVAGTTVGFIAKPFDEIFVIIEGERIEHGEHRHDGGVESEVPDPLQVGSTLVSVQDYEVVAVASAHGQLVGGESRDAADVDGKNGFS